MQVVCPNPGCGAVYTVGPQHVGKQFPCRSCGTTVVVTGDAVGAAPPSPAPAQPSPGYAPQPDPAAGAAPVSYAPRGLAAGAVAGRVRADLFTFVLAVGAVLVLIFSFMPALDFGKVMRKESKVRLGELSLEMDREELSKKHGSPSNWPKVDVDAMEKKQKDWDAERKDLQKELREAQISTSGNVYWYTWGVLFASAIVLVGALGYMATGATRTRRVVGGVLVVFIVLMVISTYNLVSIAAALGSRFK